MECTDTEDGISEVVGTLLVVALVVAFAAVAISMISGTEMPDEPKTVVVTVIRSGDTVTFTNHGGMNMDRVSEIRCWIGGVESGNENFTLEARVGATRTYTVEEMTRIVVIGKFAGNESWILFDEMV
ncbi:type IV pilin [Methanoculleus thermophilus]|jgi:hypothetical protein|uniref:Archaeal Type IV pilin N-terminal domain-containing protein n=1 Tax=Methanoculleus thermophilus TaxID=2200 RepID=A0A1G8YT10_9EURY|nr:type IV pilin [Methanoculleus thermophilus]SDK05938.1 Protein of unknown function [Methanoculleus thermophilus]HQD25587.1 type IV pilin [Methanoculleus thermophilus]